MTRYLLDIDEWSGAVETAEYDEGEDVLIVHRRCDVQPIIDNNKELANHGVWLPSRGDGPEIRLAASIPVDVAYKWLQDYGVRAWKKEDYRATCRLLDSNEWRYLRCREFRIGGWETPRQPRLADINRQLEARRTIDGYWTV